MESLFYSVCGTRPQRLCATTRAFALRALNGEFGRALSETPYLTMADPSFESLDPVDQYAASIDLICREAPVRLYDGELLAGSAGLDWARFHVVPVSYQGKAVFDSISHITCGFEHLLKVGFVGLRREIEESLTLPHSEQERRFLNSMLQILDSFSIWHNRYLQEIEHCCQAAQDKKEKQRLTKMLENCVRVPQHPPRNFPEAVQSLWFLFCFLRLCGNWPGIGRIDKMLGGYLKKDLADCSITLEEAREYLAHFWIKGCEWITGDDGYFHGSGDAQHYQNIVLAGVDENGQEVRNEVTDLVLDVVEELAISDFPISVRLNSKTDQAFLKRLAQIARYGGGVLAFYNEDLVIEALTQAGYPLSEARGFANDGCWEVQIPGKTRFTYHPFDLLQILQNDVLQVSSTGPAPDYENFELLYDAFVKALDGRLEKMKLELGRAGEPGGDPNYAGTVSTLIAMFTDGCIRSGRDYSDGGAKYIVCSPHAGGLPDTANSLYAIEQIVYREKRISLAGLVQLLRNNWQDGELLRLYAKNKLTYYGNDYAPADVMTKRVLDDFIALTLKDVGHCRVRIVPGVSTFGRQIEWKDLRGATADGNLRGSVLSQNLDPAPGTDREGVTAVLKSYCGLGLQRLAGSTALDLQLLSSTVAGEEGLDAIVGLLQAFLKLGGFFVHLDVMDKSILRQAQQHPENYKNLAVRVSGWSARFVTLDREWQEMVINRT